MTVQVVHNLLEESHINPETKIVFISLRGEIEREFTINKGLIEDGIVVKTDIKVKGKGTQRGYARG